MNHKSNRFATAKGRIAVVGLSMALLLSVFSTMAEARLKITLPLVEGFYDGQSIYYINTEASDVAVATADGTTYVPKLSKAIGVGGTADIFHVTNFAQPNIVDSVPYPVGPANSDTDYSPLWRVHLVTWQDGNTPQLLTSEKAVLDAQAAGKVTVTATDIVVNCPVVKTPFGQLPSALEIELEDDDSNRDGVGTVTLPLTKGFNNGQTVFYINTDASDQNVAISDGTNYAPKLAYTHASGAEADIFPFAGKTNRAQRNVVDSAPTPVGPANSNMDYSPLWDVVPVSFANQTPPFPLVRSLAKIDKLETLGVLKVGPEPGIIINCPIVRAPYF